jgi:hypothetical protein
MAGMFASHPIQCLCLKTYRVLYGNQYEDLVAELYKYANRSGGDLGGSGTVLIQDRFNGTGATGPYWTTRLYLDNQNVIPAKVLNIWEQDPKFWRDHQTAVQTNNATFAFDEMSLFNEAIVKLSHANFSSPSISISTVYSDGFTDFTVEADETYFIEYEEGVDKHTRPMVNFLVREGGELRLNPALDLMGLHPVTFQLAGLLTGAQNLRLTNGKVGHILPTGHNAVMNLGQIANISAPGTLVIAKLHLDVDTLWMYDTVMEVTAGTVIMRDNATIQADNITLNVGNLWMDGGSFMNVSARRPPAAIRSGDGPTANYTFTNVNYTYGQGAGHGGWGGGEYLGEENGYGGQPYGSYTRSYHVGSDGGKNGSSSSLPGIGGGIIMLNVGAQFNLDGTLLAWGGNAISPNCGGGSGGSIFVQASFFRGHGFMNVTGGSGNGMGGGAAGGRIGVHVLWDHKFNGDSESFGGFGGAALLENAFIAGVNGAAGSIYYGFSDGHTILEFDNDNREHFMPSVLMDETNGIFNFDEVYMDNHVTLHIDNLAAVVTILNYHGDFTGRLHLRGQQVVYVDVVESVATFSVAPVSFRTDNQTEIIFPTTLYLLGTRTEFAGLVTNVENLYAAFGTDVIFFSTTRIARLNDTLVPKTYAWMSQPGNMTFASMTFLRGCALEVRDIGTPVYIVSTFFDVNYEAYLSMNMGTLLTAEASVEARGVIDLEATGYKQMQGPGAGMMLRLLNGTEIGTGAGHGGQGGGYFYNCSANCSSLTPTVTLAPMPGFPPRSPFNYSGGLPYSSVFMPVQLGSGGGTINNPNSTGGSGGGYLIWDSSSWIQMDGLVKLGGGDGQGAGSAGGSGGSLYVTTLNFSGHGVIDLRGGDANYTYSLIGGGGAGGRASVICSFQHKFGGKYLVSGGFGSVYGAAGTAYREENDRGLRYLDIKYANGVVVFYKPGFNLIFTENDDHETPAFTYIMEGAKTNYSFDELEMYNYANLRLLHPVGAQDLTVDVKAFVGDATGLLHIQPHQRLYVEYNLGIQNETVAPCSFWTEEDSEIIFPAVVNLYGVRSYFEGLISNVEVFILANGADVELTSTAHTAAMEGDTYVEITEKGNFTWSAVRVERNGDVTFTKVVRDMSLNVADFLIQYEGDMFMNWGHIISTQAEIESEGMLSLDATGPGGPDATYFGESPGETFNGVGSGAGHGGDGGGNSTLLDNLLSTP